jgi:hypothetical protein
MQTKLENHEVHREVMIWYGKVVIKSREGFEYFVTHSVYKPSLPCARHVRRTAKVGAYMPVRHCGRRPTAGGWQVGRSLPCASPMRRTAKAGLGPMAGRWARLCREPDPAAHGNDCGAGWV